MRDTDFDRSEAVNPAIAAWLEFPRLADGVGTRWLIRGLLSTAAGIERSEEAHDVFWCEGNRRLANQTHVARTWPPCLATPLIFKRPLHPHPSPSANSTICSFHSHSPRGTSVFTCSGTYGARIMSAPNPFFFLRCLVLFQFTWHVLGRFRHFPAISLTRPPVHSMP